MNYTNTLSIQVHTAHPQPSFLIPQRLDIINLLHSFRGQYKRMLFLHTDAIFDTDAHAAEMCRISVRVWNVEAAFDEDSSAECT